MNFDEYLNEVKKSVDEAQKNIMNNTNKIKDVQGKIKHIKTLVDKQHEEIKKVMSLAEKSIKQLGDKDVAQFMLSKDMVEANYKLIENLLRETISKK